MRRPSRGFAIHAVARFAGGAVVVAVAALAALLGACGDRGSVPVRTIALAECRLPRLAVAAQCGELEVPENRALPQGRRIKLGVAVLPANTLSPRPDPLFILAGGPGQAATRLGPLAALLIDVRRDRDIVLVDQRGTGRSSPLDCAAWRHEDGLEAAIEIDPVPKALLCAKELSASGVDTAQYTTAAFVADLDAIRIVLGYDRINLWGGSYGTRVAQEYLRRHPAQVRSMVLDGVVPPGMSPLIDVWPTREAAFAALVAACAGVPACNAAHPDLAATLAAIGDRFGTAGRDITYTDPRTGDVRALRLTFDHVLAALQALFYVPELSSLLPEVIGRAADGDFGPLVAVVSALTADVAEQLNDALHFSVACSDDAVRPDSGRVADRLPAARTRAIAQHLLAVCAVWPHGIAPADAAMPVTSDVPVLILSGGLDPVTPPAYGTEVARTLPDSRHVIAAGYGHIVSPHACAPRMIAAFIDNPAAPALSPSCIEHFEKSTRPPLWPNRLGAAP